MKRFIIPHPWKIIEDNFNPEIHPITESLMSLGNGRMGQRANFEESYSGPSLTGNYIGGIYYPDKTRVGWWKNGYPEYFAKVLNSVDWISLDVKVNNQLIDLAHLTIESYHRELNMQHGLLSRELKVRMQDNTCLTIISERFYSISDLDKCFLQYSISSDKDCEIELTASLDFNVRNSDANYDEDFWELRHEGFLENACFVEATTKKSGFKVVGACKNKLSYKGDENWISNKSKISGKISEHFVGRLKQNEEVVLTKSAAICSSFYYKHEEVRTAALRQLDSENGHLYNQARRKQKEGWLKRWEQSDITISGDDAAQQGIRFNIFQLLQTYSGEDSRLNIGPKGFTGEKYGGSTYWDTEAFCLPFYMSITDQAVSRNLLIYRHNHLKKAIENAEKLGFSNGAALYPMVTINGEECHNEWEITFEEIHRNGAIAFAIFDYVRYTGDQAYISEYGLPVLMAISRFWSQRVHFSDRLGHFVMLGVTGPNEYENNVDNNWYTNYIARWCLQYTMESIQWIENFDPQRWDLLRKTHDFQASEQERWRNIVTNIYLPYDPDYQVFIQHDGFLNKENITTEDLKSEDRPLNQNWSWDRILRSPFIKQADVLQGLYFFEDHFDLETLRKNFDFYEPRTVHESSLSPCIHSILASRLCLKEKAYEMYLRTARLDLDNYNNDTEDGCHITSMAGTWLTIVKGFAGMRIEKDKLSFEPMLPDKWNRLAFHINFRNHLLRLTIEREVFSAINLSEEEIDIIVNSKVLTLKAGLSVTMSL